MNLFTKKEIIMIKEKLEKEKKEIAERDKRIYKITDEELYKKIEIFNDIYRIISKNNFI